MNHESPMMQHQEGDGVQFVQFRWEGVKNDRSSEEQGRPIFDNVLRVFITAPGNKNQVTSHEIERHFWVPEGEEPRLRVKQDLKDRYRRQLEAWEAQSADELAGTSLSELPGLSAAEIAACKEMGVYTVEGLAALSDTNLFMGARKWRTLAQAYLEKAEDAAPTSKIAAENEALRRENENLARERDELKALLDAETASPKPKRGGRAKSAA